MKTLLENSDKESGRTKKHISPSIDVNLFDNFFVTHASSIVANFANNKN